MSGLTYFDFLAKFGVGGAHPGGIELTKNILSKEQINNHSSILDAGCGTGQTAAYLYKQYKANVYGLDNNPIMIKKARKRFQSLKLPITLLEGSVTEIPYNNDIFDFVLSESVIAFVHKPTALKEFFRVLKKNGRLIANEMTINRRIGQNDEYEIKNFYGLDSLLSEENWRQLFSDAGFKKIEIKAHQQKLHQGNHSTEFDYSNDFDPELFNVLNQHAEMIIKYHDVLSYRIITCTK